MSALPKKPMLSPVLRAALDHLVVAGPFTNPYTAEEIERAKDRLLELHNEAQKLSAVAKRTPEQDAELQRVNAQFDLTDAEIKRLDAMARPSQRKVRPDLDPEQRARISGGYLVGASKESGGFQSWGDFGKAVIASTRGRIDQRFTASQSTFGNEDGALADGGFSVPPAFKEGITAKIMGEDSLLPLCDLQFTAGDRLTLPRDNVAPWDNSAGIKVNWTGEGASITPSKPELAQVEVKLAKLAALVPLSDELIEDAPALSRYLQTRVPEKLTSAINNAIIAGDGVAKPQGMINSPSAVDVAIESGQDIDAAILWANIAKMHSRMFAPLRRDAVWIANQDAEPFLLQMVMPASVEGGPVMRALTFDGEPGAGRLLGRQLITSEHCPALGTPGDLCLVSPKSYLVVMKTSGVQSSISQHVWFDQGLQAMKFQVRLAGQSHWQSPAARGSGSSATLSNVVRLAARS